MNVKKHVEDNKGFYVGLGAGVALAGITFLIMRQCSNCSISRAIGVTAKRAPGVPGKASVNALEVNRGGLVLGNSYALNNVSFISSNRQGPPSWVVRCLETGNVFTSQRAAALAMKFSESHLSEHLNGLRDHIDGYHFERICLAA
jgi:hypothetical protein